MWSGRLNNYLFIYGNGQLYWTTSEFKYKLKETELSLFSLDKQIILFDKELQLKNEAEKLKDKKKRNATSFSF